MEDVIKFINYIKALASVRAALWEDKLGTQTSIICTRWLSAKIDHWPVFEIYEPLHRREKTKHCHHLQSISVVHNGLKKLLTRLTYSTCSTNIKVSVQGRTSTFHKLVDKVVAFKAELEGPVKIEVFDKFQTLQEFWERLNLGFLSLSCYTIYFVSALKTLGIKKKKKGFTTHLWQNRVNGLGPHWQINCLIANGVLKNIFQITNPSML